MKFSRILTVILAFLLACSAIAEIDWASMSDEELTDELAKGMTEMMNRGMYIGEPVAAEATPEPSPEPEAEATKNPNKRSGKATLFDAEGVKVLVTTFEVVTDDLLYDHALVLSYTAENNSDKNYEIYIDKASINDWEVDNTGYIDIGAGHKAKGKFALNMDDADVSSLNEVKRVTFTFRYDKGDYNYVTTEPKNIKLK